MAQPSIQTSFHAGEWAPALNARVDLAKYHSAAALLRNFFVDYRGGASTRVGSKYVIQARDSNNPVRLIPFQASISVGYILEFGENYLRFIHNGAPVLETATVISGITKANPGIVHDVAHGYNTGDWIYISAVAGMTQVNGKYFTVVKTDADHYSLLNLLGTAVDTTLYSTYTSGGTAQRIYTIVTPYAASDLENLKFAQNVSTLILCHPSYQPYILTLISATNWTLLPIVFGSTVGSPSNVAVSSTLSGGSVNYSYIVTAVDADGQEGVAASTGDLLNKADLRTTAGTNTVSWDVVTGARSYNVYKAEPSYAGAVVIGAAYGFIGNCTSISFADSNISPDYSLTPPIIENPFLGAGVASVTVTAPGAYTAVPDVAFTDPPSGGQTATGIVVLQAQTITIVAPNNGGLGYSVGEAVFFASSGAGVVLIVATIGGGGAITAFEPLTYPGTNRGTITTGPTPANPCIADAHGNVSCSVNIDWGVGVVSIVSPGAGYLVAPTVSFNLGGGATATAVLGDASAGNPSTVTYFQQRLVLAAPAQSPQQFNMSQPGSYFNFNVSNPIQASDAITGVLVSGQLNTIQSMISMPSGLMMLSDKAAWQVDGGSNGAAVTPLSVVANSHSYNGASGVPPIVANFDILYVQAKGSIVRDLTYNFYANIFTGTDISVLSSHLFYGYQILEWAWAEEPFKIVWAIRNDGTLLSLTFLKEQELIGWSHSDTDGLYKSVATVTENVSFGLVDAVYTVVQRTIQGAPVKYIERFAERIFPNGVTDAWCVDAGLQYSGSPATSFSGGEHLAGKTVTGLADGVVITPFVMAASGNFTLATPASKVTVGLAYTCDLQTLAIDLGEPTVQGKMKQINGVTVRCQDALGLKIGRTFSTLVAMKDLIVGNVGSATNEVVTGLVTGDAQTIIDASWTVPGQYCLRQSFPLPATILGIMPETTVGDTKESGK